MGLEWDGLAAHPSWGVRSFVLGIGHGEFVLCRGLRVMWLAEHSSLPPTLPCSISRSFWRAAESRN